MSPVVISGWWYYKSFLFSLWFFNFQKFQSQTCISLKFGKFLYVILNKDPTLKMVYNEMKIKANLYYIHLLFWRGQQKSGTHPTSTLSPHRQQSCRTRGYWASTTCQIDTEKVCLNCFICRYEYSHLFFWLIVQACTHFYLLSGAPTPGTNPKALSLRVALVPWAPTSK